MTSVHKAAEQSTAEAVSKAMLDMRNALGLFAKARLEAELCAEKTHAALAEHFAEQRGWDWKSAAAAVSSFKESGFGRKNVKKFVAFVRGMFFDDSDESFRSIRCVGLSAARYKDFYFPETAFEDAVSGNQFVIATPFAIKEEYTPFPCSAPGFSSFLRGSPLDDEDCMSTPAYALVAPNKEGYPCDVARSYDAAKMRAAVAEFVAGGCLYSPKRETDEYCQQYLPPFYDYDLCFENHTRRGII